MKLLNFEHPDDLFSLLAFKADRDFDIDPRSFLSDSEILQFQNLNSGFSKGIFLQSRFHLKTFISSRFHLQLSEIDIEFSPHGKPYLKGVHNLDFNISHSGDIFAIGISGHGLIGVDIEKEVSLKRLQTLANKFFLEDEKFYLSQINDISSKKNLFTKIWTAKEATIKALGGRLLLDIGSVSIDCNSWVASLKGSTTKTIDLNFYNSIAQHSLCVAFINNEL